MKESCSPESNLKLHLEATVPFRNKLRFVENSEEVFKKNNLCKKFELLSHSSVNTKFDADRELININITN